MFNDEERQLYHEIYWTRQYVKKMGRTARQSYQKRQIEYYESIKQNYARLNINNIHEAVNCWLEEAIQKDKTVNWLYKLIGL